VFLVDLIEGDDIVGSLESFKGTKRYARNMLRPVVIAGGAGFVELEYYKGTTTGNNQIGSSQAYYRAVRSPPTPPGELTVIGNQTWELGVNFELFKWSDEFWWQTPLLQGVQTSLQSGSTDSIIMNLYVLAGDESVLGCFNTTSISTINSTSTTIASPISDPPTWAILASATMASSGSFQGQASAFRVDISWTGEVHTNGPGQVGAPVMTHVIIDQFRGVET
jgi:hypothetical protein